MASPDLPPPPRDPQSPEMVHWYYLLWQRVVAVGGNSWTSISKLGSSLGDLEKRDHSDLQNLNTAQYSHLTADQVQQLTGGGSTALHTHANQAVVTVPGNTVTSIITDTQQMVPGDDGAEGEQGPMGPPGPGGAPVADLTNGVSGTFLTSNNGTTKNTYTLPVNGSGKWATLSAMCTFLKGCGAEVGALVVISLQQSTTANNPTVVGYCYDTLQQLSTQEASWITIQGDTAAPAFTLHATTPNTAPAAGVMTLTTTVNPITTYGAAVGQIVAFRDTTTANKATVIGCWPITAVSATGFTIAFDGQVAPALNTLTSLSGILFTTVIKLCNIQDGGAPILGNLGFGTAGAGSTNTHNFTPAFPSVNKNQVDGVANSNFHLAFFGGIFLNYSDALMVWTSGINSPCYLFCGGELSLNYFIASNLTCIANARAATHACIIYKNCSLSTLICGNASLVTGYCVQMGSAANFNLAILTMNQAKYGIQIPNSSLVACDNTLLTTPTNTINGGVPGALVVDAANVTLAVRSLANAAGGLWLG